MIIGVKIGFPISIRWNEKESAGNAVLPKQRAVYRAIGGEGRTIFGGRDIY